VRRARLRTLAATLATLAAVVGAGFVVQATVLGRPAAAPQLVARVLETLKAYRRSRVRMTIDGAQLTASCRQYWQGRRRVAAVSVSSGPTIVEFGSRLGALDSPALEEFELAGCPRPLSQWLADAVNDGAHLAVTSEELDGRGVYAISAPSAAATLEVFVTRAGKLPVALSLDTASIRGTSELDYGTNPAPFGGKHAVPAAAASG